MNQEIDRRAWPVAKPAEDVPPATLRSFTVWATLTATDGEPTNEARATLSLTVHARCAEGAIGAVRAALGGK